MITRLVVLALAAFVIPVSARASAIDLTGIGKAQIVTVAGVRNVTAWAGELEWQWVDGKPAGWESTFYSFCVDLLNNETDPQSVTLRWTDTMVTATQHGAQKAAWLLNSFAPIVRSSAGTTAMGAGLQLAIWEVLYDNDFNLSVGNFRVTSASDAALAAGQSYLDSLAAAGAGYLSARTMWLDAPQGNGQDQIVASAPEPSSMLLLGVGCVSLLIRRRTERPS